jgi:hypothetical protein
VQESFKKQSATADRETKTDNPSGHADSTSSLPSYFSVAKRKETSTPATAQANRSRKLPVSQTSRGIAPKRAGREVTVSACRSGGGSTRRRGTGERALSNAGPRSTRADSEKDCGTAKTASSNRSRRIFISQCVTINIPIYWLHIAPVCVTCQQELCRLHSK